MTEPTLKPTPKVQAGINWGALATVLVGLVALFFPDFHARIPSGFELALGMFLGSLASSLAAWCTNDARFP